MKSFSGSETDESSDTSEDAHENGLNISFFKFLLSYFNNQIFLGSFDGMALEFDATMMQEG